MMKSFSRFASLLALAAVATPAAAQPRSAAFETSADRSATDTFLFTGATVRLSLDGRGDRRPELAMRFAGGARKDGLSPQVGEGIAFSAVPGKRARLTLAGHDTLRLQKRFGMSDGAKIALIGGGILLALGVLAVVGANDAVDDINDDGGCC